MKRAQSPHQIHRVNPDRRAPRKRLGDSVERYAIVRIVECRYKNDTIRDVEVRVTRGSRSPFMITGLGKGMVTIRNGCFFATASRRRMLSTDRAWFSSAVSCSYARITVSWELKRGCRRCVRAYRRPPRPALTI